MRELLARIRDWLRRDQLDAELQEELRFHRGQLERDAGAGEAPRRLGNVTRIREQAREIWSLPWLDRLLQDVRYAFRSLRRSPGFAIPVILTLGLGIGANAAMFGLIDRMMFRPYPYLRDAGTVHRLYLQSVFRGQLRTSGSTEYARFLDFQRWSTTYAQIAAFSQGVTAVGIGEEAREFRVARVSATLFDFFDARPVLGRFFTAAEDTTPRGAEVAVLGHAYWAAHYGRRDVLGQTIRVGNITATIIGVAPEGFTGVSDGEAPAAYIPITTYAGSNANQRDREEYYTRYNWGWLNILVRRKPGVSIQQAEQDLTSAYLQSWTRERDMEPGTTPIELAKPRAIPGPPKVAAGPSAGLEAKTLLWISGVAVIVLLIACANVANLMLARLLRRRRETAVRLALGVSRGRLLAQTLTESLMLALLGGAAGVLIAQWGGATLRHLYAQQGAGDGIVTDTRVLAVSLAAALLAALVTGILPALVATREDLASSLKAGAREGTHQRSRTRTVLLVVQGALSVVLLVGAGLFVQSLGRVKDMRLGFDAEPLLMVTPNLRGVQLDSAARVQLSRRLLDAAQALPGVSHAAFVSSIPFWSTSSTGLFVAGIDSVSRLGRFTYQTATPDYFTTAGTRILRGRPFTAADRQGAPRVVVVSESMARTLWPAVDALGQCMRVGSDTLPCSEVVGIAEDAVQNSMLDDDKRLRYYLPLEQHDASRGNYLLLQVHGDPARQVNDVRQALQPAMPGESYLTARPLMEIIDGQRRSWQIGATMFAAFGVLALVVAAVGLYGVIAYGVAQRMHEMGVRIALGARSGDVVRLVVGQGMRVAGLGIVIGLGVALLLAPQVQPLLFKQSARDPATYGVVAALLLLVALAASALPAMKATRADPNRALRAE